MQFYTSVTRHKGKILARGYDAKGKRCIDECHYEPTLYVPTAKQNTGWRTLDDRPLEPLHFDSMYDAWTFTRKGLEFYGNTNYIAQYIQEKFPDKIKWDRSKIHVGNVDIEVKSEDGFPEPDESKWPVTSITMYSSRLKKYLVFAHSHLVYDKKLTELNVDPNDILFFYYKDEARMLRAFVDSWVKLDLDVVTGWNIRTFDIPYLVNRTQKLCSSTQAKRYSPWGLLEHTERQVKGRNLNTYDLKGIAQLDYMDLFKKFSYAYGPQGSYSLDHISYVVLDERKLSYAEFDSLGDLYEKDPQKYVDYNIKDVDLVKRIDDRCDYITLAFEIAFKAGANAIDSMGTTAVWDAMMHRSLMDMGVAVPQSIDHPDGNYDGGYVMLRDSGFVDWVVSYDLNSLYPSLIVQMNMSPETIIDVDPNVTMESMLNLKHNFKGKSYCVAANGARFDISKQGFLPKLIVEIYDERVAIKDQITALKKAKSKDWNLLKLLGNKQQALKILLNSLYGALACKYFRWYDLRIAEAITHSGQVAIQWSQKEVNSYLGREAVVAIDTDSNYVELGGLVSNIDEAIKLSDELEEQIRIGYEEFASLTNSYENRMVMKREIIADRGLWTAKKRYILQALDEDGFRLEEPTIKVKGIESVKSSTPEICRGWFTKLFKTILNEPESQVREEFRKYRDMFFAQDVEDIASSTSVNNLEKYSDSRTIYKHKSGAQMHVRGALIFNHYLNEFKLKNKYDPIGSGDKIKYVKLNLPNPIGENVIAFPSVFPKEFDVKDYVDYEGQFDKFFGTPVDNILNKVGYSLKERSNIDDFFS